MGKPIPLTPSTQKSGGMLDDVVARVTEARAVMFDYGGNADEVPAIRLTIEDEDGEELQPQHYKAGDPAKIQPNDDGTNFEPIDDDDEYEGIGKKTLAGTFLRELDKASGGAFEKHVKKIGDLTALEGILGRFKMVPKPKTGLGEQKYPDFPIITEVIEGPWGKGKKKKAAEEDAEEETPTKTKKKAKGIDEDLPAKKAKKKAKPEDEEEEETEDEDEDDGETEDEGDTIESRASAYLVTVLSEADGPLPRTKAANLVRDASKEAGDDDWRDIVAKVLDNKFLQAGKKAGTWGFDGTKLSAADEEE